MKDSQGRDACVNNSPSEGGTKGLKLFANAGLDEIRGTGETQDLGTAFVTMDGNYDAIGAAVRMERRVMVKEGDEWKILERDVAKRPR